MQGAITGMTACTIVIFWIVVGSFVYHVPMPTLPFSTDGCDVADDTSYALNKFLMNTPDINSPSVHAYTTPETTIDW